MTEKTPALLEKLYQAMEEEIFFYHLLGEELKKESEFLRKGSTDSLLASLRSLEVHAGEIRRIRESIQGIQGKILAVEGKAGEKGISGLLAFLPPSESQKIKDYQKTLQRLKNAVVQINARNKTFAHGCLSYGKELFSLLSQSQAESPVYIQNGKTQSSTPPPRSLNRKV